MRGLSYPLFTVGAINSLFFGAYGSALEAVDGTDCPGPRTVFTAGCLAGAAQLVLATPVDLVKVRLQAQQGRFHSSLRYCNELAVTMAAGAASSEVSAEASNPLTTRCKPPLPTDTSASTAANWVFACLL